MPVAARSASASACGLHLPCPTGWSLRRRSDSIATTAVAAAIAATTIPAASTTAFAARRHKAPSRRLSS